MKIIAAAVSTNKVKGLAALSCNTLILNSSYVEK